MEHCITADHMLGTLMQRYPVLAPLEESITKARQLIVQCHQSEGLILVCGNGGSAADAGHIVGELMKGFILPRHLGKRYAEIFKAFPGMAEKLQRPIRAISLCAQTELITAYANDIDPQMVYAQQAYGYLGTNGLLVGLSTSGNSMNVVQACKVAAAMGRPSIAFTGATGGYVKDYATVLINVPETETWKVQELHEPIYHCLCAMVEHMVFSE